MGGRWGRPDGYARRGGLRRRIASGAKPNQLAALPGAREPLHCFALLARGLARGRAALLAAHGRGRRRRHRSRPARTSSTAEGPPVSVPARSSRIAASGRVFAASGASSTMMSAGFLPRITTGCLLSRRCFREPTEGSWARVAAPANEKNPRPDQSAPASAADSRHVVGTSFVSGGHGFVTSALTQSALTPRSRSSRAHS